MNERTNQQTRLITIPSDADNLIIRVSPRLLVDRRLSVQLYASVSVDRPRGTLPFFLLPVREAACEIHTSRQLLQMKTLAPRITDLPWPLKPPLKS